MDRMPRRRRGWCAVVAAAALLAPACTTVTRTALVSGAPTGAAGPGAAASTPTATQSGVPGVVAPGGSTATGISPATPSAIVGSAPNSGSNPSAPPGAAGTGTCTTPVKIGVSYSSDEAAGLAIVGNSGASSQVGSYVQAQQALFQREADNINRHGGIGGCKVVLGFHDFKSLGSDGFSGESEAECVDFAEDQHAFAVINTTLENKTLVTCLAQHHVVSLYYGSTYQATPQDFTQYRGYLYEPSGVNVYRWGPYISQLAAAGYFPKGAKVGILIADDGTGTNQHLVNDIWKPQLQAMGITPVTFTFSQIEGFSDVSATTSQFSSAVLQFKAAGVTDVIGTPDNGDIVVFFTQVSQTQDFHPRYAFTSGSGAVAWGTEPAGQRPNALTVSNAVGDIGLAPAASQLAPLAPTPARTACNALYSGHTGSSSVASAYGICDAFNLLASALAGAPTVTPAALLAGVDRLGTTFSLADGYTNASFGEPDRYDGGTTTRMLQWNESAQQWQYISPVETVP
jgi:hypothetical protein